MLSYLRVFTFGCVLGVIIPTLLCLVTGREIPPGTIALVVGVLILNAVVQLLHVPENTNDGIVNPADTGSKGK